MRVTSSDDMTPTPKLHSSDGGVVFRRFFAPCVVPASDI